MLPKEYIQTKHADVEGTANLKIISKVIYGSGKLPVVIMDLAIDKGAVSFFNSDANSYININKLNLNATGIIASSSAFIKQPLTNAPIRAKINGDANLSKIKKLISHTG